MSADDAADSMEGLDIAAENTEEEFHFDRDEFVKELTSYYEFLVSMYIPDSRLKRPPEGGWPRLTPEKLACMGKTDDVNYVLQHIPYISWEKYRNKMSIYPWCVTVDYRGPEFKGLDKGERPPEEEWDDCLLVEEKDICIFPPEVVWIAVPTNRDGDYMILDTHKGTITLFTPMYTGNPHPTNPDQLWRLGKEWRFKDFFSMAKEQFKSLELVPHAYRLNNISVKRASLDKLLEDKELFSKYGWPT